MPNSDDHLGRYKQGKPLSRRIKVEKGTDATKHRPNRSLTYKMGATPSDMPLSRPTKIRHPLHGEIYVDPETVIDD